MFFEYIVINNEVVHQQPFLRDFITYNKHNELHLNELCHLATYPLQTLVKILIADLNAFYGYLDALKFYWKRLKDF